MQKLDDDALGEITFFLDFGSLIAFSTTCRPAREACAPLMFRDVKIDSRKKDVWDKIRYITSASLVRHIRTLEIKVTEQTAANVALQTFIAEVISRDALHAFTLEGGGMKLKAPWDALIALRSVGSLCVADVVDVPSDFMVNRRVLHHVSLLQCTFSPLGEFKFDEEYPSDGVFELSREGEVDQFGVKTFYRATVGIRETGPRTIRLLQRCARRWASSLSRLDLDFSLAACNAPQALALLDLGTLPALRCLHLVMPLFAGVKPRPSLLLLTALEKGSPSAITYLVMSFVCVVKDPDSLSFAKDVILMLNLLFNKVHLSNTFPAIRDILFLVKIEHQWGSPVDNDGFLKDVQRRLAAVREVTLGKKTLSTLVLQNNHGFVESDEHGPILC